jgi:Mobilization protein NikA
MRKTRSDPIQFRLMLEDYAILQALANEAGVTPKDYVIDLTMNHIAEHRDRVAAE